MSGSTIYTVPHRRKREGRTNYKKRLKLLLSGKHRLVVRKSLKGITASLVEYQSKGDKVITTASVADLKKLGWKFNGGNMPSSYLVGIALGAKAKKNNITEAILDIGLYNPVQKSRLYAVLAGAVDAGLDIPHSPDVLPSKERLEGGHIAAYSKSKKAGAHQFSAYQKNSLDASSLPAQLTQLKNKLLKEN